ncbi:hypothetical protein GCM10007036_45780 [Alsobacter metallidurans]|uniref:Uncharacterized protein n=1 Tax=Alsobacter metallidurans TaxID=340221 RepID=A0A917IC38_9HYPH|nr:hypothetical protein [Alsobacter metallidurans]GGH33279.1 hypothetical protein GCM10007036_45780 [Alsobacter metallidurans]
MRTLAGLVILAGMALAAPAFGEERPAQQASSPPADSQAAAPAPIRKDPAETTGAITTRKVGQESERVIDGQRCSDVADRPDAYPHALWVRCRAP